MEEKNQVTILFTDGSKLDVEYLTRSLDYEWSFAVIHHGRDEDGIVETDEVVVQNDEIRAVYADDVKTTPADHRMRVHCSPHHDSLPPGWSDIWKAELETVSEEEMYSPAI